MDNLPKDAKICAILLSSMGIGSCEPKVISAMQEYLFRYISNTLTEANSLSDFAGRSELTPADIKMAIQVLNKPNQCVASLQELVQRADNINGKPLPAPSSRLGLPKDEDCLLAVNFRVTSLNPNML